LEIKCDLGIYLGDDDHLEVEVGKAEPVWQRSVEVQQDFDGLHGHVPQDGAPAEREYG
jgi:hypothetical protein